MNYDLNLLCNHQVMANEVAERIKKELPTWVEILPDPLPGGVPSEIKYRGVSSGINYAKSMNCMRKTSRTLERLAYKIGFMHMRGQNDGIGRMLKRIAENRQKKFTGWEIYHRGNNGGAYNEGSERELRPYGHFRTGNEAYVLSLEEIARVKSYFGL